MKESMSSIKPELPKWEQRPRGDIRGRKSTTNFSVVYEQRGNVLFARTVMHGERIIKGTS